jgi:hypothetical protein
MPDAWRRCSPALSEFGPGAVVVAVIMRIYAKSVEGQDTVVKQRVQDAPSASEKEPTPEQPPDAA